MYQSSFCKLLPIKWMLCKKAFFFLHDLCVYVVCVCVLFFSHTPKAKTQNLFIFLEWVGTSFTRERWWVYWLLIVYTVLLPWQFFTLIYTFFRNVEILNLLLFFPQVTKKFWKKILNIQENYIWLKWFFKLFIYLFDKHFLKLVIKVWFFFFNELIIWQTLFQHAKVSQYMILLLDARVPPTPQKQFGGYPRKKLLIQSSFLIKWG